MHPASGRVERAGFSYWQARVGGHDGEMDAIFALFEERFGSQPEVAARAPGRIEFLGNHTDYNGGAVLGAAVNRELRVAVGRSADRSIELASDSGSVVRLTLDGRLPRSGGEVWANYPLGVLDQLVKRGMSTPHGFRLQVTSNLPAGAGLSSSAAFELATGLALSALYGHEIERLELIRLARAAENAFVGVPCGILDQGVSGYGRRDGLVAIDCRDETFSTVPLPAGTRFWIFNTNKKHALVDSLYSVRNRECQEAARLLRATAEEPLAHLEPVVVESRQQALGAEKTRRALHVTREHRRVREAQRLLGMGDLEGVGGLLLASHESSRTLFENSIPELDFLVEALAGQPGVLGARLTGGGFGGAALAWVRESFTEAQAQAVAEAYEKQFSLKPDVLAIEPADGAALLPV